MSKKGWVGRSLAKGGVAGAASYVTTTYIIPLGTPVVTVAIGYASGWPWFLIWLGALAAFAFISTGLLRFSEWRFRQQVKDKLNFDKVRIGKKLNNLGCVEWIKLGFQVHNSALFPMELELKSLHTTLDEKFPPKKERLLKKAITPAGRSSFFDDFAIVPFEPPRDRSVEGKIEFVVRYGRLGHPKHDLSKNLQIFVAFDSKGDAKVVSHNEIM